MDEKNFKEDKHKGVCFFQISVIYTAAYMNKLFQAKQGLLGLGTMYLRAVPKSLHLTLPFSVSIQTFKKKK